MRYKFLNILPACFALVALMSCGSAIKNSKTESVKVYGNCGMCEKKIEAAANKKNQVEVDWNPETKLLKVSYDEKKTNLSEILKNIAAVGYDSDQYRASDDSYNNLHACCQYNRPNK